MEKGITYPLGTTGYEKKQILLKYELSLSIKINKLVAKFDNFSYQNYQIINFYIAKIKWDFIIFKFDHLKKLSFLMRFSF